MTIYDEIEIEDLDFDETAQAFFYDCPCGDKFRITLEMLQMGEDIAECPSCTLQIRIIFEPSDLQIFAALRGSIAVC